MVSFPETHIDPFWLDSQYFRGNRDRNTVVMHSLRPDIEARVVRVHPVRWVNHISMRVEFYGRAAGMSPHYIKPDLLFSSLYFALFTCHGNVSKVLSKKEVAHFH